MKFGKCSRVQWFGSVLTVAALAACGDDSNGKEHNGTGDDGIPQCQSTALYNAFDSSNHANQDIRVAAYTQILAWLDEAKLDVNLASDRFGKAKLLYADAPTSAVRSAELQAKVAGRADDHLAGSPLQGDRLDATITAWLDRGAAATSVLAVNVAKQWVDKTLQEFLFLSVYHELVQGERAKWDEAFGYFGVGADNDPGRAKGFASTAGKRDAANGTTLRAQVFNGLVAGSCQLGTALTDAGADKLDPTTVSSLWTTIGQIDTNLQHTLVYSVGHEAFELKEIINAGFDTAVTQDTDEVWVKMAELIAYAKPLVRLMLAKGGESAVRAASLQVILDIPNFTPASDLSNVAWMELLKTEVDGQNAGGRVVQLVQDEFGILIQS